MVTIHVTGGATIEAPEGSELTIKDLVERNGGTTEGYVARNEDGEVLNVETPISTVYGNVFFTKPGTNG